MPDDTTILSLPLILPAQAQKHVTHNEALAVLDLVVQLAVINRTLTTAPALPSVGDRHIVAAGATGPWVGQSGRIALYAETGWQFTAPLPGWRAQVLAEAATAVFDGVVWKTPAEGPLVATQIGVSAVPDATNRLTVIAPATLLNHAGAGHQLKLNKATQGDTASLLFQTGFSGRAEMGTAGTDDFSVKVSADGAAFTTALVAQAANGQVTLPQPVRLGGQAGDPAVPANGTLWLNTTTGEVKVRSAGASVVIGAAAGGVADGDKGDIAVSAAGSVWTIDPGAVGLAKLADIATDSFLGRDTAGTGAPEVLTPLQARSILNVADGASANATDSALRDRATHTGTQTAATVSDFAAAADARIGAASVNALADVVITAPSAGQVLKWNGSAWVNDVDATSGGGIADGDKGDLTVSGGGLVWTIDPGAITMAKLANIATDSFLGRDTAGTGAPEVLTPLQARGILNVADGATANASDASLRDRATHTGTQAATTIIDFSTATDARIALASVNALADVTVTAPSAGQVLKWNGSAWVNDTDAGGGGGATDLSYDAATRLLSSSTGADVTLPLVTASLPGLMDAPLIGKTRLYYFIDFIGSTDGTPFTAQVNGTGAGVTVGAMQDAAPGWLNLNLGTTATGRVAIAFQNGIAFGSGPSSFAARFHHNVLSSAAKTYALRVGYLDSVTGEPADGCFFRYTHGVAAGNWQAVCRSNNAETAVDTGVAATVAVKSFRVEVNSAGTSVGFYLNEVLVGTITTTIPTGTVRETGAGVTIVNSVGTGATTAIIADYMSLDHRTTVVR